jgi:Asp-tRNA(Asn)/Glu-tRNA(Gln) amidotransferase A subunit family amidase
VHGWSDCEAEKDAAIVRQLRDAGVVLMGKTVSTPFACFDPAPTRNPLELACTPGGSSSGSAAGVADGHVMWALGSQTGGSITRPAAFCGIAGFKPTFGRLSLDGVFPISEHLDHLGFLCQSAADAVWIWNSLTGESATGSSVSRVADLKSVYQQRAQPEVVTDYQLAVDRIAQAGIEVETVDLPDDWDVILAVHLKLMAKEAAQTHRDWFEQRRSVYPPRVSQLIERGLQVQDSEHSSLLNWQKKWQQRLDEWFADGGWDALLMPSAPTTAPRDLTTTGDPSFNSPWSLSGLPTLTIPLPTATQTLPSGLQLVGARGEDHRLLALGNRFERSTASMFSE